MTRDDLLAIIEDSGYRATVPRTQVVSLISKKSEGFSAEGLSSELPEVGRATVYRTLRLLLDVGVICKLALPNGDPMYTLSRFGHHHHTVCIRCGGIGEFRAVTIERLLAAISREIPGKISGHRIEFYITCVECLTHAG